MYPVEMEMEVEMEVEIQLALPLLPGTGNVRHPFLAKYDFVLAFLAPRY